MKPPKAAALFRHPLWTLGILLPPVLLSACGAGNDELTGGARPQAAYIVEPVFAEFYDFLGGEERLGLPLSPLHFEGQIQTQYFEAAQLVYDPSAAPSERYSLAPLGEQMDVRDEPLPNPGLPNVLFVEGYIVYEGFASLYQEMGGQRYVGKPLTGVRYIESQNRVEQYFENLGFYINLDGPSKGVQLMAYGQLACAQACGSPSSPAAIIQIDLPYGEPFISTVSALGDALVGQRIAGPYKTADGSLEVIYENMVLFTQQADSRQATPRPILALLGVSPDAPVPRLENPNVMFYAIEGQLGFNVPLVFADYIAQHGGFEIFGAPISEVKASEDGTSSQCYANLCLRYERTALGGEVQPMAMGLEYKRRFYDQPAPQVLDENLKIQIQVWEDHSQINSSREQVIHASLFSGNQLLEGLQPYLLLTLPNGGVNLYQFPPTDSTGHTQLTIPPVLGQNGTLVPYQVCLEGLQVQKTCATESYLIWGNP